MESVHIDTDPAMEAMVPRPDPSEELREHTATILDEADERLFDEYAGHETPDLASAIADGGRADGSAATDTEDAK